MIGAALALVPVRAARSDELIKVTLDESLSTAVYGVLGVVALLLITRVVVVWIQLNNRQRDMRAHEQIARELVRIRKRKEEEQSE